jgi:DNA replicative helicase MCM subunit Mcm2 (Cdc46/Mcm family)
MAEIKKKAAPKKPEEETQAPISKERKVGSFWTALIPLSKEDKARIEMVKDVLQPEEIKELEAMLKSHKARFAEADFGTSPGLMASSKYLMVACNVIDSFFKNKVEEINSRIVMLGKEKVFAEFSTSAEEKILPLIAPNILGMEEVKRAGLIQLFAKEKVHILLLGDPATGKTDILRSIADFAPISSFGLGSGTSKAGLTVAVPGKEIIKGLLPLANNGIACIDELNLLKTADRAGLLNAMEKGFITYDKADSHLKLDANVNVFATANPEGERFVGRTTEVLKQQIPFDPALLSRFHLLFLIRKPSTEEFLKITDNIIKGEKKSVTEKDKHFIKEYVAYALSKNVEFDKSLSSLMQGFVSDVKKDEDQFIVEISPRMVIGIMNMAKAAARMKLKDKVEKEDVIKVLKIFNFSLYLKKDEREK